MLCGLASAETSPNPPLTRCGPRCARILGPCALASLARTRRGGKNEVRLAAPHCGQIVAAASGRRSLRERKISALRARAAPQLRVAAKR